MAEREKKAIYHITPNKATQTTHLCNRCLFFIPVNNIHHGLHDEDGEDEAYGAEHPYIEGFEVGIPRELR